MKSTDRAADISNIRLLTRCDWSRFGGRGGLV